MTKPYKAIIAGCKAHKPSSQRELYGIFAPKMLAICMRYAQDKAEAEDILQDSFIKVFKKIQKYDDRGSLEGWIRRITVNTAIDHIRKRKNRQGDITINEAITEEVSESALDQLELEFLFKLIQALPPGYRVVFNLYAIEGYSHAEIGEKLNISESTSRSQYTRARAMLKTRIKQAYMETNFYQDAI